MPSRLRIHLGEKTGYDTTTCRCRLSPAALSLLRIHHHQQPKTSGLGSTRWEPQWRRMPRNRTQTDKCPSAIWLTTQVMPIQPYRMLGFWGGWTVSLCAELCLVTEGDNAPVTSLDLCSTMAAFGILIKGLLAANLIGPGLRARTGYMLRAVQLVLPEFEKWADTDPQTGAGLESGVSPTRFRKDLVIEVHNETGQLIIAYRVFAAWPAAYQALPVDAHSTAMAIQTLRLESSGWERGPGVGDPSGPESSEQ
jgi:hypothetical protein